MNKKKKMILVTGGAGFIGSYVNRALHREGYSTIIIDDLSRGRPEAVSDVPLLIGDIGDPDLLDRLFTTYPIDAVLHFAGSISVGESFSIPAHYYRNNVINTLTLLEKMLKYQVNKLVFSSSAAVYGTAQQTKISEEHPLDPINPYGKTKMMVEQVLDDYHHIHGMSSISLRYFNAAGGDPIGDWPLYPRHEHNLIPIILKKLLTPSSPLQIFGSDYPTHDGTCVRDYVHLDDLARAHLLALEAVLNGVKGKVSYNLGNGDGYSNLDVVKMVEAVTGEKVDYTLGPRREGDVPRLVADGSKAARELGWHPQYPRLEKIVQDAWKGIVLGKEEEGILCT